MMKKLLVFILCIAAVAVVNAETVTPVSATHSTAYAGWEGSKTIDSSGFDEVNGYHSTSEGMWLATGTSGEWIVFDLGGVYDLSSAKIWNYNFAGHTNRGIEYMDIQVSDDGVNFTTYAYNVLLNEAPGTIDEDFGQVVTLDPAGDVTHVKFLVISDHGGSLAGISEIRFEGTSSNTAPDVDAGDNIGILGAGSVVIDANVTDDGNPSPPGSVSIEWSVVSGNAANVSFEDDTVEDPNVTFSAEGFYTLQIDANDGQLVGSDTVNVKVLPSWYSPVDSTNFSIEDYSSHYDAARGAVNIINENGLAMNGLYGAHDNTNYSMWLTVADTPDDQWVIIDLGAKYDLNGIRIWTGNGAPYENRGVNEFEILVSETDPNGDTESLGTHNLAIAPGNTTDDFSEFISLSPSTDVRYVRLDINSNHGGGNVMTLSEIILSGTVLHSAPSVDAGENHGILLAQGSVALDANATDDGLPGALSYQWSVVDGNASEVSFSDDQAEDPVVSFTAVGHYVLQVEASDGDLSATDTVNVKVLPNWYLQIDNSLVSIEDVSDELDYDRRAETTITGDGLDLTNGYGTHANWNSTMWLTTSGVPQWVIYDLGSTYNLNGVRIWNGNDVTFRDRDVQDIEILVSESDPNGSTENLGAFTLAQAPGTTTEDFSELLSLSPSTKVRYVKLIVNTTYSSSVMNLSEIKFSSGAPDTCEEVLNLGFEIVYDYNDDCKVDFADFAVFAGSWLDCLEPGVAGCDEPWLP